MPCHLAPFLQTHSNNSRFYSNICECSIRKSFSNECHKLKLFLVFLLNLQSLWINFVVTQTTTNDSIATLLCFMDGSHWCCQGDDLRRCPILSFSFDYFHLTIKLKSVQVGMFCFIACCILAKTQRIFFSLTSCSPFVSIACVKLIGKHRFYNQICVHKCYL